jgi:hypothetical protein
MQVLQIIQKGIDGVDLSVRGTIQIVQTLLGRMADPASLRVDSDHNQLLI